MLAKGEISMSLGNKILELRKIKGLSQEQLGERINVTRQTISNWELGETSPNPEQLKLLSKELNVSIDELLDNDIQNVIEKKVSDTQVLAKKILKTIKRLIFTVLGIVLFTLICLIVIRVLNVSTKDIRKRSESIHCKLYGEEHSYDIVFNELTGEPLELGGDSYFADILELDKYNDAHQIFNIINDYVKKNGGTCEMIQNKDLSEIVNVSIKEGTLTKTGATIIITESVDYDILYGEPYWIEKFNYITNEWEKIKVKCDNCAFNLPAYDVTPNHPLVLKHDWYLLYGELPKGYYRLVKEAFFNSDIPISDEDKYTFVVEFSID